MLQVAFSLMGPEQSLKKGLAASVAAWIPGQFGWVGLIGTAVWNKTHSRRHLLLGELVLVSRPAP